MDVCADVSVHVCADVMSFADVCANVFVVEFFVDVIVDVSLSMYINVPLSLLKYVQMSC